MQNNKVQKKLAFVTLFSTIIGIISSAITIGTALFALQVKGILTYIIAAVIIIIAWVVFSLRKKISRGILSAILNLTSLKKDYKLVRKEVVYEFIDRTHMRHEKTFNVKVLQSSFRGISDKFKWTGETPLTVKSKDPRHYDIEYIGPKFGLERYNVNLPADRKLPAGECYEMTTYIDDIHDPNGKSSLHLSAGVYEKTDYLVLKILFNPTLNPVNARRLEYIHYNDDNFYMAEPATVELDGTKKCLTYEIKSPFYGGKYLVEWEFA